MENQRPTLFPAAARWVIGQARSPQDPAFFTISPDRIFAWVGLGSDGLSSSCYGPPRPFSPWAVITFSALCGAGIRDHHFHRQFQHSKSLSCSPQGRRLPGGQQLLSPTVGMISGSALLVDYVLTITLSVASGADALFSFLPPQWYGFRLPFAVAGVLLLGRMI